jgi:putative ABC transport system permease protein
MLRSYIVVALRNLLKNKAFSLINISGLSLGVACCLLLALYVQDEMSYDQHHHRKEDLYRIVTSFEGDRGLNRLGTCSPPIAMAMRDEIPEVEDAARLLLPPGVSRNLIRYEDNVFYETNGFVGDSTVFNVLTFEFTQGNPKKALAEPNSVVITETLSKKLFGNEPALNKVINITQGGPKADFKVTGVFKANPKSIATPNFIVSISSSGWGEYLRSDDVQNEWAGQNFIPSYLKLAPGHSKDEVIRKMNEVLVKFGAEDMKALGLSKTLSLEPVKDIYLYSDINQSPRIVYLYVIASIAVFILLLACINFMNLSTAKATKRASEIGIRKVMGAFRGSLIRQILGEAMVLVLIAMLFSMVLIQIGLPFFNNLTGKEISFNADNASYFALVLVLITVVTGLLAGSYPAFYLSSFQPAQVLKGKISLANSAGFLRQSLVVFQFIIGITLVCGMIIISKQLNFVENTHLGFDPEAKIVLPLRTESAQTSYETLKKTLGQQADVKRVSATDYIPGSPIFSDFMLYKQGGDINTGIRHRNNRVDHGYLELMDIKLIAGRSFNDNRESESQNKVIINRASVYELGLAPEQAIGIELYTEWQGKKYTYEVIGVMEDYHQTTLKEKINPTLFFMAAPDHRFDHAIVDINTKNVEATLQTIQTNWKSVINDTPFEYSFLDENIQKQYEEDRKVSQIITVFTTIAMLISCLGLYGLSTYMAERRFKEIGVRKVMGASVNQIVGLMSKEFVKLVIIAFVISVPLAWYTMNRWLEEFEYRITVDAMVFVYAGAAALCIALLTVSFESFKAASTNPVNSLRSE